MSGSTSPTNPDVKLLPPVAAAPVTGNGGSAPASPTVASAPAQAPTARPITTPARQLADLPREELAHLAEELGLDPTRFRTSQHLVAAIHDRRQMIASLDREAMMDVIRWGRRPVLASATHEQLAMEIARVTSMRFHGLTQRGLVVLARMRGVPCRPDEPIPALVKKLKKQESVFEKINRKRRAWIGQMVSNMLGEAEPDAGYRYLPPPTGQSTSAGGPSTASGAKRSPSSSSSSSIKDEIEEAGLLGGLTSRLKKTADNYLNQKLDEVEARIDRKLDEIDRRLAEWRDKEIANRIRILKITLWASVIVAVVSLLYAYVKVYFMG